MTRVELRAHWLLRRHVSPYPKRAFIPNLPQFFTTRARIFQAEKLFLIMSSRIIFTKISRIFALSPFLMKKEESEIAPLLAQLYSEKYKIYPSNPVLDMNDLDQFLAKSIDKMNQANISRGKVSV